MCGIAGIFETDRMRRLDQATLTRMTEKLAHRGPDDYKYFLSDTIGFGFRRLSLIDIDNGAQPIYNESKTIVSVCNGEIVNYKELRKDLMAAGHQLQTRGDCEVIPHLYEEYGINFLSRLNGQFALALYDSDKQTLYLARDPFGVNPLYYAEMRGTFIFASEVKALLEHQSLARTIDLVGLDQVMCFPGVVSPRTMFAGISSLKAGHYVRITESGVTTHEYWDLDYPTSEENIEYQSKAHYVEELTGLLNQAITLRLTSERPVGTYLSGGLDSSLVAGMVSRMPSGKGQQTFSISFPGQEMCERIYQRKAAKQIKSVHYEIPFGEAEVISSLQDTVYHAESPLKETYNTACLMLAKSARERGVPVILTGQGSDELFAGYIGYRFDHFSAKRLDKPGAVSPRERQLRRFLWGDDSTVYDNNYAELEAIRATIYSERVNEMLKESNALTISPINTERLRGRHIVHKRSYLDCKLRLADHLLTEHGDHMAMAHGVELRHPFLDMDVAKCAVKMPPNLKLNAYAEKYIVKQVAQQFVDDEIIDREKFAWYAPGSPLLLQKRIPWIQDLLSVEKIRRDGYFNPEAICSLTRRYSDKTFTLNQPFDGDLLMIVLTFNILLEQFGCPALN